MTAVPPAYVPPGRVVLVPGRGEVFVRTHLTGRTDSPYLAPVPHRGRANEPAFVALVGAAIAAAKDLSVADVEMATWSATARAFRLPEGVAA